MTKTVKMFDGTRSLPVTDAYHAENYAAHPGMEDLTQAQLAIERRRLMDQADELYALGQLPTEAQQARLAALTRVMNTHSAMAWLGDTPLSTFGFEGADQVHGNHHHLPCGCILRSVHDHNLRLQPEKLTVHPHRPMRMCSRHPLPMGGDIKAHFELVAKDNASGG